MFNIKRAVNISFQQLKNKTIFGDNFDNPKTGRTARGQSLIYSGKLAYK